MQFSNRISVEWAKLRGFTLNGPPSTQAKLNWGSHNSELLRNLFEAVPQQSVPKSALPPVLGRLEPKYLKTVQLCSDLSSSRFPSKMTFDRNR